MARKDAPVWTVNLNGEQFAARGDLLAVTAKADQLAHSNPVTKDVFIRRHQVGDPQVLFDLTAKQPRGKDRHHRQSPR